VVGGQISVDNNISTENGNPYGAFVNAAVQEIGQPPSRIAVTSATFTLDPVASTQVTVLDQVFTGTVRLSFLPNGTSSSHPVASVANPAGVGPVPMVVVFDSATVSPSDYASLVGGSFKDVLTGTGSAGFATRGATADIKATLTFEAFD
jgi:hypothetical protein